MQRKYTREHLDIYSVVAEPGYVAFISSIEQNRSSRLLPVFVRQKVSLFEGAILKESKMVNLWQF